MTDDQTARCDALAKRIAELDPNWVRPGMACRDPKNNGHWRKLGGGTWAWDDDAAWPGGPVGAQGSRSLEQAITNGLDWHCQATLGCLLLSLGDFAVQVLHSSSGYEVVWDRGWNQWRSGPSATTRAEAILAAKVAQLEANHA